MIVVISANKLLRSFYWAMYLGLCFIGGWFALRSGVLDNYFSRKTSLSLDEEISTKRPVISIRLFPNPAGEKAVLNINTQIHYCPSYHLWQYFDSSCQILGLEENKFFIPQINKTEKVFLEGIESFSDTVYRIIPMTKFLEKKATATIKISTLKDSLHTVGIFLTSLENSLGSIYYDFKDGSYLYYKLDKNSYREVLIIPESYYFLPETSKCQKESYYDCIASELDRFDFKQTSCRKKCIPRMFSYDRNYSTPFCQNKKDDRCARNIFVSFVGKVKNNFTKKISMKCHNSCNILQYSALEVQNVQGTYNKNISYDSYEFMYVFGNSDNRMRAYHEYLIYDAINMIGSVGGTFGLFIGFSMTGVVAWVIEFFKK